MIVALVIGVIVIGIGVYMLVNRVAIAARNTQRNQAKLGAAARPTKPGHVLLPGIALLVIGVVIMLPTAIYLITGQK